MGAAWGRRVSNPRPYPYKHNPQPSHQSCSFESNLQTQQYKPTKITEIQNLAPSIFSTQPLSILRFSENILNTKIVPSNNPNKNPQSILKMVQRWKRIGPRKTDEP